MLVTYNWESLKRHNINIDEADYVHAHGKAFDIPPSKAGNNRTMFVGFPENKNYLLEIGVEEISPEHDHLFHFDRATSYYRNLFDKRKRQ